MWSVLVKVPWELEKYVLPDETVYSLHFVQLIDGVWSSITFISDRGGDFNTLITIVHLSLRLFLPQVV